MLTVTFLGTGAATPTVDRNVAGLAVQREGETILFDCGEGTQRQMMRYGVGFSFTEIFFTHYHADHMLGVTGLLRTMGLQDRTAPVTLYGPRGAAADPRRGDAPRHRAQQVSGRDRGDPAGRPARAATSTTSWCSRPSTGPTPWATRWPSTPGWAGSIPSGRASWAFPRARSGAGCTRARRSRSTTAARSARRTWSARRGADARWSTRATPGRTSPLVEAARGADLLIHEATFGGDELERANETGHSTAAEAARVALEAGVRRLVLTHISPRYTRDAPELLAEARAVFPGDGDRAGRADGGRAVCGVGRPTHRAGAHA